MNRERAERALHTLLFLLLSLQVSSQAFRKVSSVPTAVCLLSEGCASSHACQHATVSKPAEFSCCSPFPHPSDPCVMPRISLAFDMLNLLPCPTLGSPTPPLAAEEISACVSHLLRQACSTQAGCYVSVSDQCCPCFWSALDDLELQSVEENIGKHSEREPWPHHRVLAETFQGQSLS